MKKYMIISGSILCLFVICSLTFHPIIAVKQIEHNSIVDDIKKSDFGSCDCKSKDNYPFVLCYSTY